MEITLRKFKYSPYLSEETNAYAAEVFADGKKIGTVKNDGHGGCSLFYPTDRELSKKAEDFCVTLPGRFIANSPMTLEDHLDELAQIMINEKEIKSAIRKIDNLTAKSLVIVNHELLEAFKSGKSDKLTYTHIKLMKPARLYTPEERKRLVESTTLKPGEKIYNVGWV
jgi:hypothetical protein